MTKYDKEFHPKNLVELMAQGALDCEIYAEWDICKDTFYTWRNEHEEFQEAFNRGLPKCEAWYTKEMKRCWKEHDDKGFKYCIAIMNNKFGWERGTRSEGTTNNIQIGNVNVLQQLGREGLIDDIKRQLEKHKDIIDVQVLTNDSD